MIFDALQEEEPTNSTVQVGGKGVELARQRLMKDFAQLDLPENCQLAHDKLKNGEDDLMNWLVIMRPGVDSKWHKGTYKFRVTVPENFPIEPPTVKLPEPIFHPNIDMDGNVC